MKCSVDDCSKKIKARGWCMKHYRRWRLHGDPLKILNMQGKPEIQRFEAKIELITFSTCHWWTGYIDKDGYGTFRIGANKVKAHRAAYRFYIGEIPERMLFCHTCDNTSCVNPAHLFLGTNQDNMDDMVNKGRSARGEGHGWAKLTNNDVAKIRSLAGLSTHREIAEMFGISKANATQIINRKIWKHIA